MFIKCLYSGAVISKATSVYGPEIVRLILGHNTMPYGWKSICWLIRFHCVGRDHLDKLCLRGCEKKQHDEHSVTLLGNVKSLSSIVRFSAHPGVQVKSLKNNKKPVVNLDRNYNHSSVPCCAYCGINCNSWASDQKYLVHDEWNEKNYLHFYTVILGSQLFAQFV